jgi:hypothetical protein
LSWNAVVAAECLCNEAALLQALIKDDILTTFVNYALTQEQQT